MIRHLQRAALGATFALLAAPALAQEDGLKPLDPDQIKDLGGWLGEDEVKKDAPPAGGADPLAGSAAPAPEPQELDPVARKKREKQIDRNYDKAQEIYQGIIKGDKVGNLDRRIANNERIVKEFNDRIRGAIKERRDLQVQVFNRSFYLKQQVDRGQISEQAYNKMISEEEQKYERQVAELKRNVTAWRAEVLTAKKRLEELKAQRRMLMAQRPRRPRRLKDGGKATPKVKPGERLLTSLRAQLKSLDKFETRHTLTGVHPRDLGSRPVVHVPMTEAPASDADDEEFWEDDTSEE